MSIYLSTEENLEWKKSQLMKAYLVVSDKQFKYMERAIKVILKPFTDVNSFAFTAYMMITSSFSWAQLSIVTVIVMRHYRIYTKHNICHHRGPVSWARVSYGWHISLCYLITNSKPHCINKQIQNNHTV